MRSIPSIILCQPDSHKGCSVCCGLFNFIDTRKEILDVFLQHACDDRDETKLNLISISQINKPDVRDYTTYICPYQGYIENGRPGCRIHPQVSGVEGRDRSLYGVKICNSYFCPAHSIIPDSDKLLLINHVDCWYLYSRAIIDPAGFVWIAGEVRTLMEEKEDILVLKDAIVCSLETLSKLQDLIDRPLFFYSIAEYYENLDSFSLVGNSEKAIRCRKEITTFLKNLIL
jgi:hypothetical protein